MDLLIELYSMLISIARELNQSNVNVLSVLSSAIIISASITVTAHVRTRETRMFFVLIFAFFTYSFAQGFTGNNHGFFFNLSTEFVGAAVGLLLFDRLMHTELSGIFLLLGVAAIVLVLPFVFEMLDRRLFNGEFIANLRTDLLGAFTVAVLLNRDWLINMRLDRAKRDGLSLREKEKLLNRLLEENRKRNEALNRLDKMLKDKDRKSRLRTLELPETLTTERILLLVEGCSTEHVENTLDQVFSIQQKMGSSYANADGRVVQQTWFTIYAPQGSFSQQLYDTFTRLIQTWADEVNQLRTRADFDDTKDAQTADFLYGMASGYELAVQQLKTRVATLNGNSSSNSSDKTKPRRPKSP